ncbi:preprotein translocase subunit SecG [Pseudoalteromonas piscicida]|uniref:Protein-export membrane protein SecG n=1 Tax=Pseudoalteromonas piscicida TaxID=43662 RepID=A0AAD0RJ46_PSEO7|nr:preprotein translocase subunit SecG [Pseudoalteromonas piscicida]ASD66678.1 preprotein translocase subunit SecG [Pseudoalteromonas piscicida]AXQ97611.1 preprotein translocase subunit SecG [Pseudoalteromonas piscicida]AXR02605.1 preprotein translocase subunit SecG [Pseudoalteromonas piscicida]
MYEILMVVYLIVALALIGMVLIQQGKGADMGSSFGAGASATVFGSSGAGNFMTKTTTILATIFFVLSIVLGNLTTGQIKKTNEWENLEAPAAATTVPATSDVPATEENPASDVPN